MCAYLEGCGVKTDPTPTCVCSNFSVGQMRRVMDSILSTYWKPLESSSQVRFLIVHNPILFHVSHNCRPLTASIFLLQ